jgi:hypothetical protein
VNFTRRVFFGLPAAVLLRPVSVEAGAPVFLFFVRLLFGGATRSAAPRIVAGAAAKTAARNSGASVGVALGRTTEVIRQSGTSTLTKISRTELTARMPATLVIPGLLGVSSEVANAMARANTGLVFEAGKPQKLGMVAAPTDGNSEKKRVRIRTHVGYVIRNASGLKIADNLRVIYANLGQTIDLKFIVKPINLPGEYSIEAVAYEDAKGRIVDNRFRLTEKHAFIVAHPSEIDLEEPQS